ncbi:NLRC3, partial [Symbiodinium sp. KB8]
ANFNLEEPQKLAAYLKYADIRLLRVEYLYELLREKRLLPRRQEAEEWGLVRHEEVSEWAAGTRDAMLFSVSHAWETREHPDPCGDQLNRLVSGLSLYDDAYVSDIWVFYDYVSLFQYERQTDAEYESFRRALSHMHMCYAHECNWTVRLEALTPDDVWDAALQNSEHLVMVYDDKSKTVRGHPLKELVFNRTPFRNRGWCQAEVAWSACRSRSEQNQRIDAPGFQVNAVNSESELTGKVPMAPEVFQEDMRRVAFTHRSDAEAVQKLHRDVYYEKVPACEEAVLTNLPEGELGRLAKALKDYRKLKVLRLRNVEVGEAEAEEFCKELGLNDTITKLEIQVAESHQERCSALWEALADALKSNCTVTHVDLSNNWIRDECAKALADALKSNPTIIRIDLAGNAIRGKGVKADEEEVDLSSLKLAPDLRDAVTEHMPKLRELYKALPARLREPEDETDAPMTLTNFLSIVQPSRLQSFLRELNTVKIEASVLRDLDSAMLGDLIQSPAQFLQNREEERARRELGTWQQSGHSPLPVVRLYFVGQGRAGKTTTLRRLKGEQPRADEISTFGVDIWAGEAGTDLNPTWKESETLLYDYTAEQFLHKDRKPRQAPAIKRAGSMSSMKTPQNRSISDYSDKHREMPLASARPSIRRAVPARDDEPDQKDYAVKGDGHNMTATKKGEPLVARPIGDWLVKKLADAAKNSSEEDAALQPRLQCWDLPGQEVYALCNLLYFQKRGIYVVFCDTSLDMEAGLFPRLTLTFHRLCQRM